MHFAIGTGENTEHVNDIFESTVASFSASQRPADKVLKEFVVDFDVVHHSPHWYNLLL